MRDLKKNFWGLLLFFWTACNACSGGGGGSGSNNNNNPGGGSPSGSVSCANVNSLCSSAGDTYAVSGAENVTLNGRNVTFYAPANRGGNPPLLILVHGTGDTGAGMICQSGADLLAQAQGVVLAAPDSRRSLGIENFDHFGSDGALQAGWDLTHNPSNEDLQLVNAIIAQAQSRYPIDTNRIHILGHSNGAFFAELVAFTNSSIASFAESSGGLVPCANREICRFTGSGSNCSALSSQSGWSTCDSACTASLQPASPPTSRRPAGYLAHGAQDDIVSVYYTCRLASALTAIGAGVSQNIRSGAGDSPEGHSLPSSFACDAWGFLNTHRLGQ